MELGELIALVIMLPFVAVNDFLKYTKGMPPHEAEATRASHGGALVVIAAMLAYWLQAAHELENQYVIGGLGGTALFGMYWFCVSARHARYWSERHSVRALVKIAIGIGAIVAVNKGITAEQGWWPGVADLADLVLLIAAAWCCTTGAIKFVLPLIGRNSARRIVEREIRRRNAPMRPARRR